MNVGDGGKTYYITGLWDPAIRDLLVLNTETPKGTTLVMNVPHNVVFYKYFQLNVSTALFLKVDPFPFNLVCKDLQGQDTMLFK